jgi:hypothetical protein
VQFGTSAEHSVVVEGLTEDEVAALEQLDGTHELPAALARTGATDVLAFLGQHDLLVATEGLGGMAPGVRALLAPEASAQAVLGTTDGYAVVSRRRAPQVLVCGRGALPTAVASLLRRSGVAQVLLGEVAADDWDHMEPPDRHEASLDAVTGRLAAGPQPALVVLTGLDAVDPALGAQWRRRGTPVLPVVLHGVEAVVGPLVASHGPCLRCLDLTRADLDPAWPLLLGQLLRPGVGTGRQVDGDTTLVAVAAGMTAMLALAVLDGHGVPPGRSFEVGLPWPQVRQRHWPVHPRCRCATPADREPTPTDREPTPRDSEPAQTDTEPIPRDGEPAQTDTEPIPRDGEPARAGAGVAPQPRAELPGTTHLSA